MKIVHTSHVDWYRTSEALPEYQARAGNDLFVHVLAHYNGLTYEAMYCNGKWKAVTLSIEFIPQFWAYLPTVLDRMPLPPDQNGDNKDG